MMLLQPLRRRLPLVFTVVLAAALAGVCLTAYARLRAVLLSTARDRAHAAAERLTDALDESVARVARTSATIAADSTVGGMLEAPLGALSVEQLKAFFAHARALSPQLSAVTLVSRDGRRILSVDSTHGVTAGTPTEDQGPTPVAMRATPPAVSALRLEDGHVTYDMVVPVAGARGDTIGSLVLTRRIEGPANHLIKGLIGQDASVLVGNVDGTVWTDLEHPVTQRVDVPGFAPVTAPDSAGNDDPTRVTAATTLKSAPWRVVVRLPESEILAPARRFLVTMSVAGLALLLVAAMATWYFTRRLTRPLIDLRLAARDIALGDFSRRVLLARRDELGDLATAFNLMAERMQGALGDRALREADLEAANRGLRESEARYRQLVELSPDAIIVHRGGRLVFVNPAAVELFGATSAEQLIGTPVLDLVVPSERDAVLGRMAASEFESRPTPLAQRAIRRVDGERRETETVGIPFVLDGRPAGLTIIRDVTERRRAEEAARESESRFRHVAMNVPGMVYQFYHGPDGSLGFKFVNDGSRELFGLEPATVLADPDSIVAMIHPDDVASFHASGDVAIEKLIPWRWEGRVTLASGEEKWVQGASSPERQADGSVLSDGVFLDITAPRKLEEQLRQAQKMEAVGQLAGGVAHDFNNILTAITSYSELLLQDMSTASAHRDWVAEIRAGAGRAAALTRQLLAFSRRQMLQPRVVDLNRTVRELENMLRRLIIEDVTLVVALDPALGAVKADPSQLEQVIVNLAVNARDAMPHGGSLTIQTSNVTLDAPETDPRGQVTIPPGQYVRIAVSDTGIGMDEPTLAHIFEPFFTTKEPGTGTGLGLSTVYGIVKQSGGYIRCSSEPGAGSVFKVYLPRVCAVEAPVDRTTPSQRLTAVPRGTETVLLVEDDVAVRDVVKRILERNGYTVHEATNGAEALAICATAGSPIDLIVTDMVMPEMSGPELGRQIRARHPDTAMLFMSGYTQDAALRQSFLEPGMAFIEKPFTPAAFAVRVREVLDRWRARGVAAVG